MSSGLLFRQVADDGQLEQLVLVSLHHQQYPEKKPCQVIKPANGNTSTRMKGINCSSALSTPATIANTNPATHKYKCWKA